MQQQHTMQDGSPHRVTSELPHIIDSHMPSRLLGDQDGHLIVPPHSPKNFTDVDVYDIKNYQSHNISQKLSTKSKVVVNRRSYGFDDKDGRLRFLLEGHSAGYKIPHRSVFTEKEMTTLIAKFKARNCVNSEMKTDSVSVNSTEYSPDVSPVHIVDTQSTD